MTISAERLSSRNDFFDELPVFDPDPGLWARIQGADRFHRRRKQRVRWGVLGGACASLLLVYALSLTDRISDTGTTGRLAARQIISASPRETVVSLSGSQQNPRGMTHLRLIDAELQAAYDRNAADEELKALWTLRNEVLRAPMADARPVRLITRI